MIPVRLSLHNFLSYGENVQPLEFQGMHVACLSGSNGHGKSALLDAITWTLWGKARSNQDDDLVRQGQSEMQVELDFEFDGNLYRVIRKRTLAKRSMADLQFQVFEGEGFRSLTEPTVSQTEAKIRRLLRLDYDTFINSAFLMQGRADEFTSKSPRQRKDVLAEILGLRLYDDLVTAAREKARMQSARREMAELSLKGMEEELAKEEGYREQITALQSQLEAVQKEAETLQERYNTLIKEKSALDALERERQAVLKRLTEERQTEKDLLSQIASARQKVEAYERVLLEKEAILASHARLGEARACLEDFEGRWRTLQGLERERMALEGKIAQERQRLEMTLRQEERALQDLRQKVGGLEQAKERVLELEAQVEALAHLELERSIQQTETEKRASEIGALKQEFEQRRKDYEALQVKVSQLQTPGAECPLCRTPLSPEHRKRLGQKLQEEYEALKAEGVRLKQEIAEREAEGAKRQQEIEKLGEQLKKMPSLQAQLGRIQEALSQMKASQARLPEQERLCESLTKQLEGEQFASDIRDQRARLVEQIQAMGYDESLHQKLREEVESLRGYEEKRLRLEQAESDLGQAKNAVLGLESLLEKRQAAIAADEALQARLATDLTRLPGVVQQLQECEGLLSDKRAEERRIVGDLRSYQNVYARCQELKEEAKEKRAVRDAAAKDKGIYDDLAAIFGKNGIQALIIENAIPEIETEANEILARMTDNSMRITFETQRAAKADDHMIETLDIKLSDGLGTRKYELFSGGEAFRANFAIRVALSRLLARRAGARLQTLFIDEGFGSQDAEGRSRLVEAIESIQEDFALILVITHFEELKDFFPTRIEVSKNQYGSQIMVT